MDETKLLRQFIEKQPCLPDVFLLASLTPMKSDQLVVNCSTRLALDVRPDEQSRKKFISSARDAVLQSSKAIYQVCIDTNEKLPITLGCEVAPVTTFDKIDAKVIRLDSQVSRDHCQLQVKNGICQINNQGLNTGTQVDGVPLSKEVMKRYQSSSKSGETSPLSEGSSPRSSGCLSWEILEESDYPNDGSLPSDVPMQDILDEGRENWDQSSMILKPGHTSTVQLGCSTVLIRSPPPPALRRTANRIVPLLEQAHESTKQSEKEHSIPDTLSDHGPKICPLNTERSDVKHSRHQSYKTLDMTHLESVQALFKDLSRHIAQNFPGLSLLEDFLARSRLTARKALEMIQSLLQGFTTLEQQHSKFRAETTLVGKSGGLIIQLINIMSTLLSSNELQSESMAQNIGSLLGMFSKAHIDIPDPRLASFLHQRFETPEAALRHIPQVDHEFKAIPIDWNMERRLVQQRHASMTSRHIIYTADLLDLLLHWQPHRCPEVIGVLKELGERCTVDGRDKPVYHCEVTALVQTLNCNKLLHRAQDKEQQANLLVLRWGGRILLEFSRLVLWSPIPLAEEFLKGFGDYAFTEVSSTNPELCGWFADLNNGGQEMAAALNIELPDEIVKWVEEGKRIGDLASAPEVLKDISSSAERMKHPKCLFHHQEAMTLPCKWSDESYSLHDQNITSGQIVQYLNSREGPEWVGRMREQSKRGIHQLHAMRTNFSHEFAAPSDLIEELAFMSKIRDFDIEEAGTGFDTVWVESNRHYTVPHPTPTMSPELVLLDLESNCPTPSTVQLTDFELSPSHSASPHGNQELSSNEPNVRFRTAKRQKI